MNNIHVFYADKKNAIKYLEYSIDNFIRVHNPTYKYLDVIEIIEIICIKFDSYKVIVNNNELFLILKLRFGEEIFFFNKD